MKYLIPLIFMLNVGYVKECKPIEIKGKEFEQCYWVWRSDAQKGDCRNMVFIDHMGIEHHYILCSYLDADTEYNEA